MSVSAPTLCSEEHTKDKFYEELDCAIKKLAVSAILALWDWTIMAKDF